MKKVRKFLIKNSVFFDTMASLLLSGMAIIVALNANKLSEKQAELNYFENLPEFQVEIGSKVDTISVVWFDSKISVLKDISITVNKISGKAKNIHPSIFTVLNIDFSANVLESHKFYFSDFKRIKENKNNIYSFSNNEIQYMSYPYNSNTKTFEYSNEKYYTEEYINLFENKTQYSKERILLKFERIIVIRIEYLNFLNEQKVEYYEYKINEHPTEKLKMIDNNKYAYLIQDNDSIKTEYNNIHRKIEKLKNNTLPMNFISISEILSECNYTESNKCINHFIIDF